MKRAVAEISKKALLHNLEVIKMRARGSRVCAVVKANAYGHGAWEVASSLEGAGVDLFAVATVDEGVELRNFGIKSEILVLGYTPVCDVDLISKFKLTQTLVSLEYSTSLAEECKRLGISINVHLKIDTGMHRLGFNVKDVEGIFEVCTYPCYKIKGIFSHFSASDNPLDRDFCALQYERLLSVVSYLAERGVKIPSIHIDNSAAALSGGHSLDFVRAGISLYGYGDASLIPVMTLRSQVCSVRRIKCGERVGYSDVFIAKRDTTVATVPVGYADGIRRDFGRVGVSVLVDGKEARCIGNVCMDYFMVDVTDLEDVSIGSDVVIFGNTRGHTAADIADLFGTISHELLTSLSPRVERSIVD